MSILLIRGDARHIPLAVHPGGVSCRRNRVRPVCRFGNDCAGRAQLAMPCDWPRVKCGVPEDSTAALASRSIRLRVGVTTGDERALEEHRSDVRQFLPVNNPVQFEAVLGHSCLSVQEVEEPHSGNLYLDGVPREFLEAFPGLAEARLPGSTELRR